MAAPLYITDDAAAWQVGELLAGMPPEKLEALQMWTAIASAAIAERITTPDPAWTPATVPGNVKAATLHAFGYFWRNRGDAPPAGAGGSTDPANDDVHPWPTIRALLRSFKDPILK